MTTSKANIRGKRIVQQAVINWSYLNLGNVALTQITQKTKKLTLRPKKMDVEEKEIKGIQFKFIPVLKNSGVL